MHEWKYVRFSIRSELEQSDKMIGDYSNYGITKGTPSKRNEHGLLLNLNDAMNVTHPND